jgi:hypothetical protein
MKVSAGGAVSFVLAASVSVLILAIDEWLAYLVLAAVGPGVGFVVWMLR